MLCTFIYASLTRCLGRCQGRLSEGDTDVAAYAGCMPTQQGATFHEAGELDEVAIAQVQCHARRQILRAPFT